MKNTPPDDPNSKALQDRYKRLLGLKQDDVVLEQKEAKDHSTAGRWLLFLILVSAVAFGTWFFFKSLMEEIERSQSIPPGTELHQQPGREPSASVTASGPAPSRETINTELIESSDGTAEVSATLDDSKGSDSESVQPATSEPALPGTDDMSHQPIASSSFLVVLLSTKSKDKAIERAKTLRVTGYPSEVILSSSGYYGVVLRHDTSEQAEASMKAIVTSGVIKEKPYIMTVDRVKESIYPKAE